MDIFFNSEFKRTIFKFFKKTFELGIPPSGKIHTFNPFSSLSPFNECITIPDFTSINNY